MIAPNVSGTEKFSTGRHARRQLPVDRHHATRQAGSLNGTLGGNIRPDHRHNVVASAIDERPATREHGVQRPIFKRLDQSVPLQSP